MSTSSAERAARRIARIIEAELSYTNGWSVSESRYRELCRAATYKILKYLARSSGETKGEGKQ